MTNEVTGYLRVQVLENGEIKLEHKNMTYEQLHQVAAHLCDLIVAAEVKQTRDQAKKIIELAKGKENESHTA